MEPREKRQPRQESLNESPIQNSAGLCGEEKNSTHSASRRNRSVVLNNENIIQFVLGVIFAGVINTHLTPHRFSDLVMGGNCTPLVFVEPLA